jgi:hypothetical protein
LASAAPFVLAAEGAVELIFAFLGAEADASPGAVLVGGIVVCEYRYEVLRG